MSSEKRKTVIHKYYKSVQYGLPFFAICIQGQKMILIWISTEDVFINGIC